MFFRQKVHLKFSQTCFIQQNSYCYHHKKHCVYSNCNTMAVTFTGAHLLPIGEDDSFDILERPITQFEVDLAEVDAEKAKAKTATLAREAESSILELQELLEKTKVGTATRSDKDHLVEVNKKLSALKKDIKEAKTAEKSTEMELLRSTTRMKVTEVKLAMKEKDIRRALNSIKDAERVDMVFIIDCTGSMRSYIESVKNSIRQIVDRTLSTNCDMKLRLAIVGYRDVGDRNRFEVMDFTSSVDDFRSFVASMHAGGGDDAPEDMAGATKEANKLTWESPTKIAFIIADAPCHGTEYHHFEDSYPDGTPGIDIIEELETLQQEAGSQGTMTITFGRITDGTDMMIKSFQDYGVTIDQVGIEDSSKLTKTVTASVRKSIFKTVTCMGKPSVSFAPIVGLEEILEGDRAPSRKSDASLKDYTISSSVPSSIDWTDQPSSNVKVYRNVSIKKVSDLQEPIKMGLLRFVSSVAGKSMSPTDKTYESRC